MRPPPAPAKKLRVLCLHGHRTNARVMAHQLRGLRAALGDDRAEFLFLDGPHLARGPTDDAVARRRADDAPFYEWWDVDAEADGSDGSPWALPLVNYESSMAFLTAKMEEIGPVDVAVGFSQGAAALTVLYMFFLQHRNERLWKASVCVGAIPVLGAPMRGLFTTPDGRALLVPVPSIHVVGRDDPLHDKSLELAAMHDAHCTTVAPTSSSLKKMVVFHDGGHKFPSAGKYTKLYASLAESLVAHCRACEHEVAATARL